GEVLDDDVARGAEAARDLDGLGLLEVERDAALPLVVLVEVAALVRAHLELGERRQHARDADAGRRLDADHLGAEVRQLERAERAGPHPGEVGDADAFERTPRHQTIPAAASACASTPISASTSAVCWPRHGAGRRISHGVAEKWYGAPGIVTSPATGCAIV